MSQRSRKIPTTKRWRLFAVASTAFSLAAAVAVGTHPARAQATSSHRAESCTPRFYGGGMHLCGPAVAHFRGFTFKHGTCKPAKPSRATQSLVLELGELHPGDPKNGGKPYLKIQIDGPFTDPTSGTVISWLRGTRWAGYGQAFDPVFLRERLAKTGFSATRTATGADPRTGFFQC
jgi:hypothetical protein